MLLWQLPNQQVLHFCIKPNRKHNRLLSVISQFLKKTIHDNENKDKEITSSVVRLNSSGHFKETKVTKHFSKNTCLFKNIKIHLANSQGEPGKYM